MIWKGVRAVEGARLESVYRSNFIMGSNPILSAKVIISVIFSMYVKPYKNDVPKKD